MKFIFLVKITCVSNKQSNLSISYLTISVQFESHYCDQYVRRLTESTFYNLSWHGQTSPKLCDFSFTGGESSEHRSYTVCFESLVYDLPYSVGDIVLQVKNETGSKSQWVRAVLFFVLIFLTVFFTISGVTKRRISIASPFLISFDMNVIQVGDRGSYVQPEFPSPD